MTPEDPQDAEPRLWLSALADGDAQAAQQACALWRGDAEARRAWHAYHLIGDVLRSDELASAPRREAALLDGLRERLAQEPVLLAPTPTPVQRWQAWLMPAAAAAGFVAVAGVLVVLRMGSSDGQAGSPAMAAASGGAALPGAVLLRDPRLDEFLRAHQQVREGVAVAAPGGALRRVEAVAPVGAPR